MRKNPVAFLLKMCFPCFGYMIYVSTLMLTAICRMLDHLVSRRLPHMPRFLHPNLLYMGSRVEVSPQDTLSTPLTDMEAILLRQISALAPMGRHKDTRRKAIMGCHMAHPLDGMGLLDKVILKDHLAR